VSSTALAMCMGFDKELVLELICFGIYCSNRGDFKSRSKIPPKRFVHKELQ